LCCGGSSGGGRSSSGHTTQALLEWNVPARRACAGDLLAMCGVEEEPTGNVAEQLDAEAEMMEELVDH
jgi:hypothetical protein